MWHVWERGEVRTGFWWGNLKERDNLIDQDVDRVIRLMWILQKSVARGGGVLD